MLSAYDDRGFVIKDIPMDDTRIPTLPILTLTEARAIQQWAKQQRPDVSWKIVGDGPYGVHEEKPDLAQSPI